MWGGAKSEQSDSHRSKSDAHGSKSDAQDKSPMRTEQESDAHGSVWGGANSEQSSLAFQYCFQLAQN